MTGLVVGGVLALFLGHHHRAALGAHHDLVLGALEVLHVDEALVGARGEQRRLVDEVGKVGAGHTGRATRQDVGAHVGGKRHLAHVHQEDLLAAADVGQADHHLAVEAAGAQQRRVEHVGAVGGGDHDDAGVGLEAVHLDQQLVQCLLALVVAAAEAGTALAADGINLVDEDDAGRILLRLFEHVAHACGAHADEHLDEVGAGDAEERHLGFAGDRTGKQRLAGPGRADHQHTTRDAAAEFLELGRILEEFDQLGDIFLGLVAAGDVGEGDRIGVLVEQARTALAERERTAATTTLHLAHEKDPHANQQQHGEPGNEQAHQERRLLFRLGLDLHAVLQQIGHHPGIARRVAGETLAVAAFALQHVAFDHHLGDLLLAHLLDELRVGHLRLDRALRAELVEHRHQDDGYDQPDDDILRHVVHVDSSARHRAV